MRTTMWTLLLTDLLEGGLSTGECLRLLFAPYRRKLPATNEPEPQSEETSEEKKNEEGKGVAEEESQSSDQMTASSQEKKEIDIQRSWFNLVCYGLPNLIVTQM